jgi:O-antigen ligase
VVVFLIAWILFAFAGFEVWTLVPLATGVAILVVVERPRVATGANTILDLALIACLAVVALQMVPLAPPMRSRLAPGAVAFDRALRFAIGTTKGSSAPASIEVGATRNALFLGATIVALFWAARATFTRGGLRVAVRGISWIGLVLAPLTIVTHAISPKLIYGIWAPYAASAQPYGPFVNRNDLACWLVMAIPLTIGYITARTVSRESSTLLSAVDATALWLAASVLLMIAALLGSASRSGLVGFAVALICLAALSPQAWTRRRAAGVGVVAVIALVLAGTFANLDLLMHKAGELSDGVNRRQVVWRFTWTMVRDFWPAGAGLGTFQHAILLYAQPFPLFYINHAHNQYLQFAAEGGLFLLAPLAVALVSGGVIVTRRLRGDRTPVFWIRAGAASGMLGLLVHSCWEATFRMPANAALFAVLAAIAMHQGSDSHRGRNAR